jgi:hypothetical protein
MKKILLIGNANNESYRLAKYLEYMNISTTIILITKGSLDDPGVFKNLFSKDRLISYLDWRNYSEEDIIVNFVYFKRMIQKFAKDFDLIIGNQHGIALLSNLDKPIIILNTGSDLTYYCNENFVDLRTYSWELQAKSSQKGAGIISAYKNFRANQISTFKESVGIITYPIGLSNSIDSTLRQIGCENSKRFSLITGTNLMKIHGTNKKSRLQLSNFRKKIFVGSRLINSDSAPSDLDDKGSNLLYSYIEQILHLKINLEFTFFNKGDLAPNFFKLIQSSRSHITFKFYNELRYNQYIKLLLKSDLIIDSLGKAFPARVSHDALSNLKLVLCNISKENQLYRYGNANLNFIGADNIDDFIHIISNLNRIKDEQTTQGLNAEQVSYIFDPIRQVDLILSSI